MSYFNKLEKHLSAANSRKEVVETQCPWSLCHDVYVNGPVKHERPSLLIPADKHVRGPPYQLINTGEALRTSW